MGRLAAKNTHEKRPFKPQIYKSRGQHRSYGQGSYQSRLGSRNRGQFMDNRPRQNYRGNNFRGNTRGYSRQNNRGNYGNDYNRDRNRSRERTFTRNYSSNRDISSSNSRLRSWSRANTNRDRMRCYKCREYDHFARDCSNSREERDLEQLQQMLNMEEQIHRIESSDDDYRSPLNL